ncbi:sirohydrochlorin chelatase [Prochlorococcus marinus]|uniref:Sirohydrochlorin chelatase n=1 Tax=Prochlorococcus marinus XMU1408 TaxID=2213228 RepID=A0A318QZR4_PROMR|nr:sirohydrochlorin chelatase [Prochlorococcus marinus]MBW3041675.1 sirohydrochlorin chelatase [Prochlorococcus marinus str. XMU1408]PYE02827.1 sirohydrochlorin chelatase [Prochlorococcus marinus XMU1408]
MINSASITYKYPSNIGIVLCGHGSRDPQAEKEFINVVEKIKSRIPNIPVLYGFLEFNRPIISSALDQLRNMGVERVIALPAMLFAAGHAKNDIPAVLNKYSAETGLPIQYGRELGLNSLMIGAAGARIKEIIDINPVFPLSETLLVVAGRGSSDPDANSNVCKITRMLVEGFGFGWGETVFSGVTFPLVEPGLRHALKLGFKRVVLLPYFLFSGVLVSRVRDHSMKVSNDNPDVQFLNASYLSDQDFVIDTFMERFQEVLKGENFMNCALCKYRSNLLGFESEVGYEQISHHHHFEGILENCPDCGSNECDCKNKKKNSSENKEQEHSHQHFPYPHAEHPLGPVTLRSLNN